jgi:hypothetical protein
MFSVLDRVDRITQLKAKMAALRPKLERAWASRDLDEHNRLCERIAEISKLVEEFQSPAG